MDIKCLKNLAMEFNSFLVVEEGVQTGSFGEGISSFLAHQSKDYTVQLLSLPDSFVDHGPRDVLLNELGLSENGILSSVKKIMENFPVSV